MTLRNVIVVAPFSPGVAAANLGAAKKIELVLSLLSRLGFSVHLVDSSHSLPVFAKGVYGKTVKVGHSSVTLWRPPSLPSRKFGKLLHVLIAEIFMRRLVPLEPTLVWLYNSYSFEARAGFFLQRHSGAKVILELEDLPTARQRSLNPKPWLDQRFFPRLLAAADLVTYVNAAMQRRLSGRSKRAMLLPSLLQQILIDSPLKPRFCGADLRVGYFGGLHAEKGADMLLAALPHLPDKWKLVVTGVGELTDAFAAAMRRHPERLEFHGRVAHEQVLALMQGCDAIVNPHTPIAEMNNGVFPFKVCEALASGALLISTELPSIEIELDQSTLFFDGTVLGFTGTLCSATDFYTKNFDAIRRTCGLVRHLYSEEAVLAKLHTELDAILAHPS